MSKTYDINIHIMLQPNYSYVVASMCRKVFLSRLGTRTADAIILTVLVFQSGISFSTKVTGTLMKTIRLKTAFKYI